MAKIKEQIREKEQKKVIVKGLCALLEKILDSMEKASGVKSEMDHELPRYLNAKKLAEGYLSEQEMERYQGRYQELMERNVMKGRGKFRISP